jgi:uncharacterized protein YbjT (DUF2867 family)
MKIVVIGGSGRVGGDVVRRLASDGHDAVAASPAAGVDTITGGGLAELMAGAEVVVAVSNAPVWDDDAVGAFFTTSTRNLLAAERDAGVEHHLAPSFVGAERLPDSGYLRAKAAQEAVAGLATGAPVGGRVEVGGPEALGIDAWGRRLFAATGDERTVIGDPHARYFGTELHGGEVTQGDGARIGAIDFETWFATHPQGARR